ncbi:RNA polymerase sigma-70 factor (ECF subfamily) [Actinoplanes lutulentus]|uniref:RNA polymerase sigma-70 factor (ECF subfamily) n=1 Tax=Actinoplanes lutulentus TaxID=1287878 RepID=A0A327ZA43_9ACTN|nr:sigma-70 family RNA polymerase sigma factor [Actinoplanes lutulentus]MBB2946671.1 RNA polymerase sigma-70 factor (ECF subfamily) [Actinoplanes lutulentus]RAK35564.1 RNA polymerase sigma-70 factor (ECF subfamily) [Actinoplanes lutulentus]
MRPLPVADDVRIRDELMAGSEECLGEVYDRYSPAVYGLALQMTRDRGAAEDITQEVFVDLWQRPERFDPHRAPLGGWLSMIARRRGIDWVRRRRTQASVIVAAAGGEPEHRVEDAVLTSTTNRQVRRAVADLPATHRQAVMLAYYDGLTYREVALALNIPEGTAKWRLRNALHRIGEQLTAEGIHQD